MWKWEDGPRVFKAHGSILSTEKLAVLAHAWNPSTQQWKEEELKIFLSNIACRNY